MNTADYCLLSACLVLLSAAIIVGFFALVVAYIYGIGPFKLI